MKTQETDEVQSSVNFARGPGGPRKHPEDRYVSLTITLPPHIHEWVTRASAHTGQSRSAFISQMLQPRFEQAERRRQKYRETFGN